MLLSTNLYHNLSVLVDHCSSRIFRYRPKATAMGLPNISKSNLMDHNKYLKKNFNSHRIRLQFAIEKENHKKTTFRVCQMT